MGPDTNKEQQQQQPATSAAKPAPRLELWNQGLPLYQAGNYAAVRG